MTTIAQQNVALFLKNLRADPLTALKPPQSAVNSVAQWFKERSQPKKIIIKRKKKKKTTTRLKKMTAGMSVLMTSGLMVRVRGFLMDRTIQITPKMLKNYLKKNEKDLEAIFDEEILYPRLDLWCYWEPSMLDGSEDYEKELKQWCDQKEWLKKGSVAMREAIKKMAEEGTLFCERSFGEGQDTAIYNAIVKYAQENYEIYEWANQ